jgi:hypothetical protein
MWRCVSTGVLEASCTAAKILQATAVCGGTNLCGADKVCPTQCCMDGSYCERSSSFTWRCSPVSSFKGGLVNPRA